GGTTEFQTPVAVEFPQVGDDVYATRLSFQVDTIDIEFGAVVIRDGAWIQILGVGAVVDDGSTITFLEDLVRVVKDRGRMIPPFASGTMVCGTAGSGT